MMTDDEREKLIEGYRLVLTHESDLVHRRQALRRLEQLVGQRSPAQVKKLEIQKGLRRA